MHPGEPEAQMMKNHEGTRLGYNAQAVVDSKAGIIVAGDVTTDQNDMQQLVPMLQTVQEELGKVAEETVADGGYCSGEQLDGQNRFVLVNLTGTESRRSGGLCISKFTYDAENDCYQCPMGQKLVFEKIGRHADKRFETRSYRCKSAKQCPVRWDCCRSKRGRCIERSPYTDAVVRQKRKQAEAETRRRGQSSFASPTDGDRGAGLLPGEASA
jgi:hypothetical protein